MRLRDRLYLVGSGEFGLSHEFDCHVYALDVGDALVMIDSGAGLDVERILENLAEEGLDKPVKWVLLTHGHADHAGGAHVFQRRFGCKVAVGEAEAGFVERGDERGIGLDIAKRSGFYAPDYIFHPCRVDIRVRHGDLLTLGDLSFRAFSVRGHSPGSTCYLVEMKEGRALFTGDVVFAKGVIGLLNCEGSSLADYRRHLPLLRGLGVDMLLPGHGVFVLSRGQVHIDMACERLERLQVPPNFI